jgi:DNA-binding PadR family transcriptional regulator
MPLHHAVLALLVAKPAHGYELKASFEEAVGEQWGGLNIGHLYQILDRLRRDGLVETERQPQPIKPDRLVHHLTPAGRQELDRWLAAPTPRARGHRDDFFLKLMAAVQSGDDGAMAGVLARQRAHLLRELRALANARPLATTPVVGLLVTAAELHVRADLQLVDAAETALGPEVVAQASTQSAGGQASAQPAGGRPSAQPAGRRGMRHAG